MTIHPKVIASGAGIGVGTSLATLIAWGFDVHGTKMPPEVVTALGGLLDFILGIGAAYLTPSPAAAPQTGS